MILPNEIQKVIDYLRNNPVTLPKGSGDARRDSGEAEKNIIACLQNSQWDFHIKSPNIGTDHNRAWYDIQIANYYCDIKISELNTADNTNAKKAIFYFLTGVDPIQVSDKESSFFACMKKKETPDDTRDYYYIVVNKNNPSDVFAISLKHLKKVQTNASNLPFQCKWKENRDSFTQRTWHEAKKFLLSEWAKGIQKKLQNTNAGMPTTYPEFFDQKNSNP